MCPVNNQSKSGRERHIEFRHRSPSSKGWPNPLGRNRCPLRVESRPGASQLTATSGPSVPARTGRRHDFMVETQDAGKAPRLVLQPPYVDETRQRAGGCAALIEAMNPDLHGTVALDREYLQAAGNDGTGNAILPRA